MKILEKKLNDRRFDTILDIATRDGAFIKKIVKYVKEYDEIIGIDISDESIRVAKKLAAEMNLPANFHRANIYDIDKIFRVVL